MFADNFLSISIIVYGRETNLDEATVRQILDVYGEGIKSLKK